MAFRTVTQGRPFFAESHILVKTHAVWRTKAKKNQNKSKTWTSHNHTLLQTLACTRQATSNTDLTTKACHLDAALNKVSLTQQSRFRTWYFHTFLWLILQFRSLLFFNRLSLTQGAEYRQQNKNHRWFHCHLPSIKKKQQLLMKYLVSLVSKLVNLTIAS